MKTGTLKKGDHVAWIERFSEVIDYPHNPYVGDGDAVLTGVVTELFPFRHPLCPKHVYDACVVIDRDGHPKERHLVPAKNVTVVAFPKAEEADAGRKLR